jgi:hypothetical protein
MIKKKTIVITLAIILAVCSLAAVLWMAYSRGYIGNRFKEGGGGCLDSSLLNDSSDPSSNNCIPVIN